MIKSGYLGFLIFVSMMIVFFILPDLPGLQKPFRILLGISFAVIYFALLIKKEISPKTLWAVGIGGILVILTIFRGTFQASFVNAYLCLFGLFCIPNLFFNLTPIRKTNLNYIYVLSVISILIQFLVFSSVDGRPSLAYEINWSAAILFLFFLNSDILNYKYGKYLIIVLSLITISRLLIFSIIIFYLIRYFKIYFQSWLKKLSATSILFTGYIFIIFFSVWYVANIKAKIDKDSSISRMGKINDESNQLRFLTNTLAIGTIYTSPLDTRVLLGFGPVENYIKNTKGSLIMPHNELLDAIVEFGIITVIFFALFSMPIFNKVTSYSNIEYLIPLLFYTLILWVRFLIVPSFEMLFILFMLNIANKKMPLTENTPIQNAPCFSGL